MEAAVSRKNVEICNQSELKPIYSEGRIPMEKVTRNEK